MTARDRLIIVVLAVAGALAAFWFLALTPKRDEAHKLEAQIATEQQRLDAARTSAAQAEQAKAQYDRDYAMVARMGKAVPSDDGVPSLLSQLQSVSHGAKVDFLSLKLTAGAGDAASTATPAQQAADLAAAQKNDSTPGASGTATAAPATQTATATLPPGATVGSAGFPTMPFSFAFSGGFFQMQRFFADVERMVRVRNGQVAISGRLLTIDGFGLAAADGGFPRIKASISATGYLLPADEGPAAGATPAGPSQTASASDSSGGAATAATVTGVK